MNDRKKTLEITGCPLYPVTVGNSAFICEANGMRRTSTVLSMETISRTEIQFETCNTNYYLHIIPQEVTV
jgi:hypothetical protein